MRSPAALLALSAVVLTGAPVLAAPAAAPAPSAAPAPAPAPPAGWVPPGYSMTPAPYGVPYGMAPAPYGMAPAPFGAPGAAPAPYGPWMVPPALTEERRSKGMRTAGLVLFGVGGATTTAGLVVLLVSELNSSYCDAVPVANDRRSFAVRRARESVGVARQALTSCDGGPPAGATTMAIGALVGVIGLPLFVVGNAPVLVPAPTVRVGVGTADLTWSF
jgi:hypothetical protein